MPDVGSRVEAKVPFDVSKNVFDLKNDDDLVPMVVDEGRRDDEGEKKGKPAARRVNGGAGHVDQASEGTTAEKGSDKLVGEIMKTALTIDLGTLLGISPVVKRGLVSAVRDTTGSPAPTSQKRNATTVLNVGYDEQDEGPTPGPSNTKEVHLAVARDDLLRLRVGLGETVATAIVDTGSQLNLVSERVFMESGLIRTEENIVSVTSATGEGNTCIGTIPEAEIYLSSGKIVMAGPEIHVIKHAPFQVLLGRPWLTMNRVSIEERKEGTCLVFELDKTRYVINVSPNPNYANGEGGAAAKKGKTSKKESYVVLVGEDELVYETDASNEEEETSESEAEAKGQDVAGTLSKPKERCENKGDNPSGVETLEEEVRNEEDEDEAREDSPRAQVWIAYENLESEEEGENVSLDVEEEGEQNACEGKKRANNEKRTDEETEEEEVEEEWRGRSCGDPSNEVEEEDRKDCVDWEPEDGHNHAHEGYHKGILDDWWGLETQTMKEMSESEDEAECESNEPSNDDGNGWDVEDDDAYLTSRQKRREETRGRKKNGRTRYQGSSKSSRGQKPTKMVPEDAASDESSDSLSSEDKPQFQMDVSTHEEVIKLIRAGASETEWKELKDKEHDRIEEGEIRWKAMQARMTDEELVEVEESRLDEKEPPVVSGNDVKDGGPRVSRKRKAPDGDDPIVQEQVIRRSERARKTTYKARQPEYERFMRRTRVTSETTTQKRPAGPRPMPKKVFSLMLRPVGKETLDGGSMDGNRSEGLGSNDGKLKMVPRDQHSQVGSGRDDEKGKAAIMESGNDGRWERASDVRNNRLEHEDRELMHSPVPRIELRVCERENGEGKSECGGGKEDGGDDSGGETSSLAGENRAKGKRGQQSIKAGRIKIEDLTNLTEFERYWYRGRLRPRTTVVFAPPERRSMLLPPPTPVLPRVYLPTSPNANPSTPLTTQQRIYPPHGLCEEWSGIVLVATSVNGMYKRVLRPDLTQTVITMTSATFIVEDPQTKGKHFFRGHATLTYESELPTFEAEVPLPDTEAVDGLWNDIFRPVPKITRPFPSDVRRPEMLGPRIDAPTTQVVRETVSLFDSSGGRFKYSPGSLQAHVIPANEAAAGKGTRDEPFDADAWIAMLEFATGVGPSPADVALRQKSPDVSRGGKKDGEGGEERERTLGVKASTVSHSKLRRKDGMWNLRTIQENDENYDADDDALASSVSSISEAEFKEMWRLLRPTNPEPLGSLSSKSSEEDLDSDMSESSDEEEELEPGEVRDDEGKTGEKVAFFLKKQGLEPIQEEAEWSRPEDVVSRGKEEMWAAATAMAKEYAPLTPPSTPDSLPSLLTNSDSSLEIWKPEDDRFGGSATKTSWYDPVYATMGHLDEVQRQVSDLQRKLTETPQDPFVTWSSYSVLDQRMYDLEDSMREARECLTTHQSVFEAYEEAMEEQLDRRFKGLRDVQERKIRANDERLTRVEDRMIKGEVHDMLLSEKVEGVRAWTRTHHTKHGLDDGRVAAMNIQLASLETQVAILSEIVGIPSFITADSTPEDEAQRGRQETSDPRKKREVENEEKSVRFSSSNEIQGNLGPQGGAP